MYTKVGRACFVVWLVSICVDDAFEGGVKALYALGRVVTLDAGVEVCWMFARTDIVVGIVCALGGVVFKG